MLKISEHLVIPSAAMQVCNRNWNLPGY